MKQTFFFIFFIFTFANIHSQNQSSFCDQVEALAKFINENHYSPKTVNDSLSTHVFHLFMDIVDSNKRYFTQADIDAFKKDEFNIDDYINTKQCGFIDKYISAYQERINTTIRIISSLKDETLDYSGKDNLNFTTKENFKYFDDSQKMKLYWSKRIRYEVVQQILDKDSIIASVKKNFKALEHGVKSKVIQNEICLLEEILSQSGGIDQFIKEAFLNAFTNYQDPNSSFFNSSDKMQFESSVTSNQEGFGIFTSKNDNGDIIIAHIVSGSPAHKHGGFEVNDILKSLKSGDDVLETFCISIEDIHAFTNNKLHRNISFKIKKQNGNLVAINLTKELIKNEGNLAKAYVLKSKKTIGYLNIPSFYTNMESTYGLGLANDVAKALYELQKEGIEGLIIDLRFNGGGSMKEATDLSGMFINRGPVSILKYRERENYTLRDANRGSLFSKPIVVLVNSFSASASEFFASAMQDYNRAIIVGSRTHGKSSAQTILPLSESEELGFCKVTVEKFYRVTGGSIQSKGVIPDIILPTFYDGFKSEEQFMDYAFENDSTSVRLKHRPLSKLNLDSTHVLSQKRIKSNLAFEGIKQLNALVLKNYINKTANYPLTLDAIHNDQLNTKTQWNVYSKQIDAAVASFDVSNLKRIDELLAYNSEDKQLNALSLKDIATDIYIDEAYQIINDFINHHTSN
ncbi:hypothetical protein A9Q87_08305 [Flavobacteriales bacterium 34_180_T64]|nr:hypothetical protein A9Q87_08305 [Flavobacteriales bacterium 34_180_T64]